MQIILVLIHRFLRRYVRISNKTHAVSPIDAAARVRVRCHPALGSSSELTRLLTYPPQMLPRFEDPLPRLVIQLIYSVRSTLHEYEVKGSHHGKTTTPREYGAPWEVTVVHAAAGYSWPNGKTFAHDIHYGPRNAALAWFSWMFSRDRRTIVGSALMKAIIFHQGCAAGEWGNYV